MQSHNNMTIQLSIYKTIQLYNYTSIQLYTAMQLYS